MATFTERIRFIVEAVTGNAERNLKSLGTETKKVETQALSTRQKLKNAWSGIGTAAVVGFGAAAAKKEISAASDLAESSSKAAEIFGASVGQIQQYAEGAAESIGLSQRAALDAASSYAILGEAAGLSGDELVGFSTRLTTLSADLASFNNTSVQDASDAIASGLRGEAEPLRKYGVLLDDATLKAEAMALGIYDGSGALTQQQKILAAQSSILKQTTIQQGDYERTSGSLANTTKSLNAQLENLSAKFGEDLAPNLAVAVGGLSDVLGVIGSISDALDKVPDPVGVFGGFRKAGVAGAIVGVGISLKNTIGGWFSDSKKAEGGFHGLTRAIRGTVDALERAGAAQRALTRDENRIGPFARVWDQLAEAIRKTTIQVERAQWAEARSVVLDRHREAAERATRAEERLAAAIRDRAAAALEGTNTILDMADAQANMNEAFDEWKKQHHEAVFAKELELDPAAEADEAAQSLRDAARAALRVVEMAAAAGGTEVEKANIAVQTLEQILRQAPWLQGLLGGTLANLRTATSVSVPVIPSTPLGGVFGAVTAPSRAMAGAVNVTINNPPGTDGRQVARGFEEWTRVNGTANTSGLP